jgi:hypothetical protein
MKAKIHGIDVEGDVDDIAALILKLQRAGAAAPSTPATSDASKFVSSDVAYKAIRRRSLSLEQEAVLRTLKRNHPGWTTAKQLQEALSYSPSQLAGLLGAFGKRVYATPGYLEGQWFFDQEWDYEEGANKYRLPEPVLAAVTRAKL